jgi:hypothetical protein
MSSDIAKAVNALIKSGNEEGTPLTLPTFKTIDIYSIFEHMFTEKAKETALTVHSPNLVYQYNERSYFTDVATVLGKLGLRSCREYKDGSTVNYVRTYDLMHFASCRATKGNLHKAVEKVISAVNHVAERDFTKAYLVKLSTVEVQPVDSAELEYIVISYITLTQKGSDYVKKNMSDVFISEGAMPMRIE